MIPLQNRFAVLRDQHSTGDGVHTQTPSQGNFDKTLCKKYFKLIQAHHHMQIVKDSLYTHTFPTGMCRQIKKLTQFIKPSSPTTFTTAQITENTQNWMYNNMVILQTHYTTVIDDLIKHLKGLRDLEWQVALKWARNRFKHKLTEDQLTSCKQSILNKQSIIQDAGGPSSLAATPQKVVSPRTQVHTPSSHHSSKHSESSLSLTPPTPKPVVVHALVHHRETSPVLSTIASPTTVHKLTSTSFSYLTAGSMSGESERTTGQTTATQKGIRMMGHNKERFSLAKFQSESPSNFKSNSKSAAVVDSCGVSSDLSGVQPLDRIKLRTIPYRHIITDRKALDWSITIHKPIVFIGDSNLSRIPNIRLKNVQVDSFPEANFLHLSKILQKLPIQLHTQHVVLAAGLNNRHQHPFKTGIKQLQGLWRAARIAFPEAQIHTPIIQFSDFIPKQEQQNLEIINKYIGSHGNPLPEVNKLLFKVEGDSVYWTIQTAQLIFDFWLDNMDL